MEKINVGVEVDSFETFFTSMMTEQMIWKKLDKLLASKYPVKKDKKTKEINVNNEKINVGLKVDMINVK